jgi:hypothetical protein
MASHTSKIKYESALDHVNPTLFSLTSTAVNRRNRKLRSIYAKKKRRFKTETSHNGRE